MNRGFILCLLAAAGLFCADGASSGILDVNSCLVFSFNFTLFSPKKISTSVSFICPFHFIDCRLVAF